jgi:hypothetical protein
MVDSRTRGRIWAKKWFPTRALSLAALSLVLAACSSYRSGGPAEHVCLTIRIDYAGADVFDEITVAKLIDPPTGLTVYGGVGSAVTYNQAPSRGMLLVTRECFSVSSTGTKKLIAFYRPGVTEPRPECEGVANLFSSRCMPAPGDIVAETYVDIEEGSDLVVNMKMGESE